MTRKALAWLTSLVGVVATVVAITTGFLRGGNPAANEDLGAAYVKQVQPLLKKYCLECHSTKAHKGDLDLERFTSLAVIRKDLKPWPHVIEQVEVGEMPPKGKPRPTADERKAILTWVRALLDAEARARAGDPGRVPLRRLSNAEYDCTVRDLTGVDLFPAREFPADGAAGEGFTNAAEALSDITPALFTRYLNAAKEIAEHAVLLPDGFRFSKSKTRRDWTDEGTAALRKFYAAYASGDGKLVVQPYLLATIRHREALAVGKFDVVAAKEKLNAKYLRVLWRTLEDKTPSQPLDAIRTLWRRASEKDVAALAAEVAAWQAALWKTVKIGNYVQASWTGQSGYIESLTRQVAVDPPVSQSAVLRVAVKPSSGQSQVRIFLAAQDISSSGSVVWGRPRFESPGKPPLLLRDYADYGPAFERDYSSAFVRTAKYLAAVADATNDPKAPFDELAQRRGLDPAYLKQWAKLLALEARKTPSATPLRPLIPLTLLEEKTAPNKQHPPILGWKKKGTDLPVVVANSSDKTLQIPGRVSGHTIGVHPTPQEFVAVTWTSPITGAVNVAARVAHAHPACGNGVAWWLEHRHGEQAAILGEGVLDLGQETKASAKSLKVEKGDVLVLAVDARDANHACDMTEVWLTVAEETKPRREWDLAKDVSPNVHAGNPHPDKMGNAAVWSFTRGPSKKTAATTPALVPAGSILARWRTVAADPAQQAEAHKLAQQVEALLIGPRPANEKTPDRLLYDRLVSFDSPLFAGVDIAKIAKPRVQGTFGLPREQFAKPEGDSLVVPSDKTIEIRLPAALLVGREFVVEARLDGVVGDRLVRVRAAATPPEANTRWDGPLLGSAASPAYKRVRAGYAEFRQVFPLFVCFPQVVPTDEVVTLKMFHREDESLVRLFLNEDETRQLDRLWEEQVFISRQPKAEFDYLPQFMGYTTQDTPKAFQQFFIDRKPLFQKHAEEFLKREEAAIPKQLDALQVFAEKAYRRPLEEKEKGDLEALYQKMRKKGLPHGEAFRGLLARVLTSPSFLFRIEKAPPGLKPAPVNDWELANRLSYFLWSSMPDEELRQAAAAKKLQDPQALEEQTRRMLKDPRLRALAIEFGTQWIHVRQFDTLKEKNEKLFPTFTPTLRQAIYEEAILFFQDLFQSDRAVINLLDADYTFLNEMLAKHYGIPGVVGQQWRRVEGVRKHGRGGILGLASVHAKQSGASRTSPVLRGNWVVETLLGEKLPRPPANVPILPDQEGTDKLTTRQMVEQHVSNPSCAACHVRIDPYGFAFENFDAIGRWRTKEVNGHPVDTRAKLRDGTEFDGIEGLRKYLLTKKKDVIVRLFCQKLLGYALGRATTLSDTTLIDDMVAELNKNDGRISAAVVAIVRSPQFRMIRGRDAVD